MGLDFALEHAPFQFGEAQVSLHLQLVVLAERNVCHCADGTVKLVCAGPGRVNTGLRNLSATSHVCAPSTRTV